MRFSAVILLLAMQVAAQPKAIQAVGLRLENVKYPFAVKFISHETQGKTLEMAYMDVTPAKPNGKAILLLHGKNFAGNYWEQTAKDLSAQGYRVIIPDQIGFGKSSKTDAIQYSFQLMAQQTKALLDQLQIKKITVLGHSMGGMLATRFALMYSEMTEKLILENPIGLEDWKTVVPYQSVDDWNKSELAQTYEKLKAYQQNSYYHGQWKPEYDKWLNQLAGWLSNENYPLIAKNSALLYDMIFTQPVVYEFGNLKMPVLLIIGQEDRTALGKDKAPEEAKSKLGNYPQLGKATAAKIKNAKLVELPGLGHSPHIENYNAVIKPLLEFLRQ
ncbi:MAG: alpha/beta hydrolase [Flavobacterium sp.]|nr:MAG: alpha/beta hydrolase [Flavobacterium sp.]